MVGHERSTEAVNGHVAVLMNVKEPRDRVEVIVGNRAQQHGHLDCISWLDVRVGLRRLARD
jgi:hypothetical protein